jgi:hypothetical protein
MRKLLVFLTVLLSLGLLPLTSCDPEPTVTVVSGLPTDSPAPTTTTTANATVTPTTTPTAARTSTAAPTKTPIPTHPPARTTTPTLAQPEPTAPVSELHVRLKSPIGKPVPFSSAELFLESWGDYDTLPLTTQHDLLVLSLEETWLPSDWLEGVHLVGGPRDYILYFESEGYASLQSKPFALFGP